MTKMKFLLFFLLTLFAMNIAIATTPTNTTTTKTGMPFTTKEFNDSPKAVLVSHFDALMADKNNLVAGNPNGKVTMIEFFDYQCSHCHRMEPVVAKLIKKNPQLKVVYIVLPHMRHSKMVAKASYAALQQGQLAAFHDAIMKTQWPINEKTVLQVADKIGLNVSQFKLDMDNPAISKAIEKNIALIHQVGLYGTPAFLVFKSVTKPADIKNVYFAHSIVPENTLQKFITDALGNGN